MLRSIELRLRLATVLVVIVGYFGLTTTPRFNPVILLVPALALAFMPLGERLDARFRIYRQITSFIILAYIFSFVTIAQRYSLLDAVISLVIFVQVYSLVHIKRARNYGHIFLMAFFLLLAASVMDPRAGIAPVFVLFVFGMFWALTLLEMFVAANTSVSSDDGMRIQSLNGQPRPPGSPTIFDARFSSILVLGVVGLFTVTGMLFLFGPRTQAGVLGASQAPPPHTATGISTEVDLRSGGLLQDDRTPIMNVRFPDEPNGIYNGPMYWRVTALDSWTGSRWLHRGVVTQGTHNNPAMRRFKTDYRIYSRDGLERPAFTNGPLVYQEIFLDRATEGGIPALQFVKTIIPDEENKDLRLRWDLAGDFTVLVNRRAERGVYLRAWSEVFDPRPARVREASRDFEGYVDYERVMIRSDYDHLTFQNLLPETRALIDQLTEDAESAYDKVVAVERYLSGPDFEYTRVIPDLPDENPIDAFILQERAGHCELYASALALSARALGLPARVVSGYRGGAWNENDQSYTVSNDLAHLWAEVYFTGVGWVTFDPSPRDLEEDAISIESITRAYSMFMLKARMIWLRNVVGYRPTDTGTLFGDRTAELFRNIGGIWGAFDMRNEPVTVLGALRSFLVIAVLFSVVVGLILIPIRAARRDRRGYRYALNDDQSRAVRLYKRIGRRLDRLGVDRSGKTAEELAEAVSKLRVNEPEIAEAAIALYNESRFGQRPLTPQEFASWKNRVDRLRLLPDA